MGSASLSSLKSNSPAVQMPSPSASPDSLFNLVSNVPGFPWDKLLHSLINLLVRKFFSLATDPSVSLS